MSIARQYGVCDFCHEIYKKGSEIRRDGNFVIHYKPSCKEAMAPRVRRGVGLARMRIHYIYKITHKTSGKIYIGMHRWHPDEFFSTYFGSGHEIKTAVALEGKSAFRKEITNDYMTWWDAFCLEGNLIYKALLAYENGSGISLYNNKISFQYYDEEKLDAMGVPLAWVWG